MKQVMFSGNNIATNVIAHYMDGGSSAVEVNPTTGMISGIRMDDLKRLELVIRIKEFWTQDGEDSFIIMKTYTLSENGHETRSFNELPGQVKDGDYLVYKVTCKPEDNHASGYVEHARNAGYLKFIGVTVGGQVVDMTVSIVGQRNRFFVCFNEGARVQGYSRSGEFCFPDLEPEFMIKDCTKYHRTLRQAAVTVVGDMLCWKAEGNLPDFSTYPGHLQQEKLTASEVKVEAIVESGSPRTKCWYARGPTGDLFQIHYTAIQPVVPNRLARLDMGQKVYILAWKPSRVGSGNAADMIAETVCVE